ncbi:MAG: hypothetical protein ABRQ24_01505 [Syntrophomonadaceae bacterium]
MTAILGIMAGLIFLLYSAYFYKIIKEEPHGFELELLRSLANWMITTGARSRIYLWAMLWASVLAEAFYFYLTLVQVSNLVITTLTVMFIPVEIFHLSWLGVAFRRFFRGQYLLRQVFSWPLERLSAGLFFTHSLLVVITLLFFS